MAPSWPEAHTASCSPPARTTGRSTSRSSGRCRPMSDDVLTPAEVFEEKPTLRRLLRYLRHSPSRLVAVVGLSFIGTLFALIPAVLVGTIINGPISSGDKGALHTDLFVLLAFAAVGFIAMWFGGRVLAV